MDELAMLRTRSALVDNFNSYAQGVDSKDWALVRSCFADEVALDYAGVGHDTPGFGQSVSCDGWIHILQGVINGFDITRHAITNHRFHIDDQIVRCQAYLNADHIIFASAESQHAAVDQCVTVVGEYTNEYAYCESAWKICRSKLVMNYAMGNLALFDRARERASDRS